MDFIFPSARKPNPSIGSASWDDDDDGDGRRRAAHRSPLPLARYWSSAFGPVQ